jgi:DNA polymerase I-like protein with 3'-5' exonuclease and polymerase domains
MLPDLRRVGIISLDTETKDDRLADDRGSGWPFRAGHICGVSVAWREGESARTQYIPLRHPDSSNHDPAQVFQWVSDLAASDVRIVTQNGLYDWGWLRTEAGIRMPPSTRLEEIGALATIVDENRLKYSLDALCTWRGLPGKDDSLLRQGIETLGLVTNKRKKVKPQNHIWQLPAHYVAPYAEQDAISALTLFDSLDPVLDREGTRKAYRLEVDLLPMVLAMRLRGIRVDVDAAERARDHLLQQRKAALAELSDKLGANVSMAEIGRSKWLAATFDQHGIKYPHTKKGNPSFTAGISGWMHKHPHWLPQLVAQADKYNKAAVDFLERHILGHVVNGRIHAEIHPHRSDEGGTRSLRFSYSNPPLQQMAARDAEIAPLIRNCFLPEPGEVWAKPDVSQQEFRLIVHYAAKYGLTRAQEAVDRYRNDPDTDFHGLVAELAGIGRDNAKHANFAKSYGAGVRRFAAMIGKSEAEARVIMARYDRELPFVHQLAQRCERQAYRTGCIELYDGARRHWTAWVASAAWTEGAGPCPREEAERRIKDPEHPWYRRGPLRRADTRLAMNALIQGSAARHTKLWMRACWREGIVPLLQMHDCLDLSVSSPEQAERVAQLAREAVTLLVPIQVDLKYGRTWGDAKHAWAELHNGGAQPAAGKTGATVMSDPVINNIEDADSDTADDDVDADVPDDHHRQPAGGATDTELNLAQLSPEQSARVIHAAAFESEPKAEDDQGPRGNGQDRGSVQYNGSGGGIEVRRIPCPIHGGEDLNFAIYADGHGHCFSNCGHIPADEMPEEITAPPPRAVSIDTLKRGLQLWNAAVPILGTLAERYLTETRRLDLAHVSDLDAVLRFHRHCPFGNDTLPCVLALFRDVESNDEAGIHRIALTADAKNIEHTNPTSIFFSEILARPSSSVERSH